MTNVDIVKVQVGKCVPTCGVVPFERFLDMWHNEEVDDGWKRQYFETREAFARPIPLSTRRIPQHKVRLKTDDRCSRPQLLYSRE
jgi:hypothetical protein